MKILKNFKKLMPMLMVLPILLLPTSAMAGLSNDWSELSWLLDLLLGGLQGYGGKIIATLIFFSGLWLWLWEKQGKYALVAFFVVFLIIAWPIFIDASFS